MGIRAQSPGGSPVARSSLRRRSRFLENVNAYLFIAPWLIGFIVLTGGPMLGSLGLAFAQWNLLTPPSFLGIENFREMVQDDLFWISLANTAYYTFVAVPAQLVAALLAALAVNVRLKT